MLVIFVVILVLFGPKRLPSIARTVGKTLHELRRAANDFRDQVMAIDVPSTDGGCDDETKPPKRSTPDESVSRQAPPAPGAGPDIEPLNPPAPPADAGNEQT